MIVISLHKGKKFAILYIYLAEYLSAKLVFLVRMHNYRIFFYRLTKIALVLAAFAILGRLFFGLISASQPAHAQDAASWQPGSLIRGVSDSAVYYIGADNKRYVFPNEATYFSWYHDFSGVITLTDEIVTSIPIGSLVTVRPGIRFVNFESDPKVYAVEPGGVLRWIPDENTFLSLGYRFDQIVTLSDVFQPSYTIGEPLTSVANGSMVKAADSNEIYYIQQNKKCPTSLETMKLNRYFPNHLRVTNPLLLQNLALGDPVIAYEKNVEGSPDDHSATSSILGLTLTPTSTGMFPPIQFLGGGGGGGGGGSVNQPIVVPPAPASDFSAYPYQQKVLLTWQLSPSSSTAGYALYRSNNLITNISSSGVVSLATTSSSTLSYLAENLDPHVTYYFALRAFDGGGVYSSVITGIAATDETDLNSPSALTISSGSNLVHLRWTAPPNVGFANRYAVYRSLSPITTAHPGSMITSTWPGFTNESVSLYYIDYGLQPDTDYYYVVKSLNAEDQASDITPAVPVRLTAAPAEPANYNHPRYNFSADEILAIRQRIVPGAVENENYIKMLDFQWSHDGYSHDRNLSGPLVNYSSLDPSQWTISITSQTQLTGAGSATEALTQLNNIVGTGSLITRITNDELIRQRAITALMNLPGIFNNVTSAWEPDGSYPDSSARPEFIKSMMKLMAMGYDRLYPWLSTAQRQQLATASLQAINKYHAFWLFPAGEFDFGETHGFANFSDYLQSLLVFYGDNDMLPGDRNSFNALTTAAIQKFRDYLDWSRAFYEDGTGGASQYWGWYAYALSDSVISDVEILTVATGQNWYQQYPWLQNFIKFSAYTNLPNDYLEISGDGNYSLHYGIRAISFLAKNYNDPIATWLMNRWWQWRGYNFYAYTESALYYDPALASSTPAQDGYDLDWFSSKAGYAVMRSGWSDDSVITTLNNPAVMRTQKQHQDAGTFTIYYKGPQVVNSGYYSPAADTHWMSYYRKTIAANTLTIYDPNEVFCGSRYHPGETPCDEGLSWNDGGQNYRRQTVAPNDYLLADRQMGTTTYDGNTSYAYIKANLEPAYRKYLGPGYTNYTTKASQAMREFVYLRPKTYVILDRVTSDDSSFTKRWLLHTETEPTVSGGESVIVPGHIANYNGNMFETAVSGQGKLFGKTLLPASIQITKIGGEGYEFYDNINGINYPYSSTPEAGHGNWRLEVSPTQNNAADNFLNVLYVDDANVQNMPVTQLLANDAEQIVVQTSSTAVVFSASGQAHNTASYIGTGITEHVMANLTPNDDYILSCTNNITHVVTTVEFTASASGSASIATNSNGSYTFSLALKP